MLFADARCSRKHKIRKDFSTWYAQKTLKRWKQNAFCHHAVHVWHSPLEVAKVNVVHVLYQLSLSDWNCPHLISHSREEWPVVLNEPETGRRMLWTIAMILQSSIWTHGWCAWDWSTSAIERCTSEPFITRSWSCSSWKSQWRSVNWHWFSELDDIH